MKINPLRLLGFAWLFIVLSTIFCVLAFQFKSGTLAIISTVLVFIGLGFGLSAIAKELLKNKTIGKSGGEK